MDTDLTCHLVDLFSITTMAMSLPLRCLQAAAEADARLRDHCRFSRQCHYLAGVDDVWETLRQDLADDTTRHAVAFTSLCWNSKLNLRLANHIRAEFPETLVVFGGNDVAHQAPWILDRASPVDVLVNGEGEIVFPNILASFLDRGDLRDFRDVKGVSFKDAAGEIVTTDPQPLVHRLDDLPTPFQGDMGIDIERSDALVCEFSRGCPYECAFCNWGGATGTAIRRFSADRLAADLDFLIGHMRPGRLIYIADSNFGMTDADLEAAHVLVDTVKRYKKPVYIFTNFAKNTNRRVIETATLLHRAGLISKVTLSAQSLNTEALTIARRQYMPYDTFLHLQDEFRKLGIPTYTELLIGMPGEDYQSFLAGVERVLECGGRPMIYTLLVLNNTHYAKPEIRARHGLRTELIPFQSLDLSIRAETSVGHDRLSYDEWLLCLGVMVGVPIFYFGILRFVMERLRFDYGVGYGRMFHRLSTYCLAGAIESHPLIRQLFLNFIATWKEPEAFDRELYTSIVGADDSQFGGPSHLQAIVKILITDRAGTDALIAELAGVLAQLSATPVDPEELAEWIAYQQIVAQAVAQIAHGRAETVETTASADDLRRSVGPHVAIADENGTRSVRVRKGLKRTSFADFMFALQFGMFDSLSMFEWTDQSAMPPLREIGPPTLRAVS